MRIFRYLLLALVVIFLITFIFIPRGHYRPFQKETAKARTLFNVLTSYASDNDGNFPDTVDKKFFDECVELGYLTEEERDSIILNDSNVGSMDFFYINGQSQLSRGSNLIFISTQPLTDKNGVPHYMTLAICGRAEAMRYEELVPVLAQTIRDKAERTKRAQKARENNQ